MAGALDTLGGFDPATMGLLSAAFKGLQMSGPSVGKPVGLGQVIGGAGEAGLGTYSAQQKMAQDEAYRRRLAEMEQVKTDLAKQQLEMARKKDEMLMSLLGKSPAGAPVPQGLSPTSANAMGAPWAAAPQGPAPSAPGMPSFLGSPQTALAAQALGLGGAVDLYKHLDTPQKMEGGSVYKDRRTGEERFQPKVDVGMVPQPGGGVGVAPGAPETISTLKGAEEDAKAARDIVTVKRSDGTEVQMPRSQFLSMQAPPAPKQSPASFPKETASERERSARVAVAMIEKEMAETTDPELRASLKKEADALRKKHMLAKGPDVGVSQPPGVAAAVKEAGQLDAKTTDEYRKKLPSIASTRVNIDALEALNADDKTYASMGAEFKKDLGRIAQAIGVKVNEKETANTELYIARLAELMKERLASKDYGSGTGVSNLDLIAAAQPLPEVAKTREGRQKIIEAMKKDVLRSYVDMRSAVDHFDENKSFEGFKFPSESIVAKSIPKTPATNQPRVRKYNPKTQSIED